MKALEALNTAIASALIPDIPLKRSGSPFGEERGGGA